MSEIAKKLDHLNRLIQVQRTIEMHAAIERAQLETERVELLLQLQTAAEAPALPYNITLNSGPFAPARPERPIAPTPNTQPQLPSLRAMIEKVLQNASPHGLACGQVISGLHAMGWPGTNKNRSAYSTICIMCKEGRIGRTDGRYYAITRVTNGANGSGVHP
jgi:hypothetical protein